MNQILQGDCLEALKTLPDQSINTCVTSPPYWGLRDYGTAEQLGLESTPEQYVENIVKVFREVKRILKDEGTLWLNLGDCYSGSGKGAWDNPKNAKETYIPKSEDYKGISKIPDGLKSKDLVGIPWRVAFALQADGWYLRSDIIWHKPNAMPESVRDRPTKAHEYIFLLSKSPNYYYDYESIKEHAVNGDPNPPRGSDGVIGQKNKGNRNKQDELGKRTYTGFNERYTPVTRRNKRTVWSVSTRPYKEAHFATYPAELIEPCILAGCPMNGTVLDPFFGSGTTGEVAIKNNRNFFGIELNESYIEIAKKRLANVQPVFNFQESQ